MDVFKTFKLESLLPLTTQFKNLGINSFLEACQYVEKLPYRRTSDRSNYKLVLTEQCGTCSSKHALLKALAIENNFNTIHLCIGIYKMNSTNTKGIGSIISNYNLEYIPEAHTYLKLYDAIIDITGLSNSDSNFSESLLKEEYILPDQIGTYKIQVHQSYLKEWILKESISYDFKAIWKLREQCIANLSS